MLINCPDCGKPVSDLAECCPNCARPIAKLRADQAREERKAQLVERAKATSKKTGKVLLAICVCMIIFFIYAMIGAAMGWKHGGGVIPLFLMIGACVWSWKAICGKPKVPDAQEEETDTDPSGRHIPEMTLEEKSNSGEPHQENFYEPSEGKSTSTSTAEIFIYILFILSVGAALIITALCIV